MGSSFAGIRASGGEVCVNLPVIACLGFMCGGRRRFKAYLRRAVISASMENLPAPVDFMVLLFMFTSLTGKVLRFK